MTSKERREQGIETSAIWQPVMVGATERRIYMGMTDYGIEMYFLPERNIVARYVSAQMPGDRWQTLQN